MDYYLITLIFILLLFACPKSKAKRAPGLDIRPHDWSERPRSPGGFPAYWQAGLIKYIYY